MHMRSRLLAVALAGVMGCGGGDGGGGPNPTPGTLDVVLTTITSTPGAILFTVSGGPITGVSSGYTMYEVSTAPNSRKVLLTGDIVGGTLVQIQVDDVGAADNYVVQVLQVAARGSGGVPYQNLAPNAFSIDVQ